MSSRGNRGGPTTARHRRQRTRYRTTVGRRQFECVCAARISKSVWCLHPCTYIYPASAPKKIQKQEIPPTTAAKSIRVLPILKQVPRIESAPKNACLATCDRQIANSTSDQINNIIKTKTKKIKQRPSPPQPSSSPPPPPPSRQPTSATWPTAPPSPSLHT